MYNLRHYFQLDPAVNFLNHGSFGAVPRPVFQEYQNWQRKLEHQPVEFLGRRYRDLLLTTRATVAGYLGCDADELVFTTNVTELINIIARSLNLGPGDEVLGTNHEYGALDRTWRFLSREKGFRYVIQEIQPGIISGESFVEELWKGVTSRTCVIFISHITSSTALLFPVREIAVRARAEKIITVVDGAHAPGQIGLSLRDLGVDFYGGNFHKWLCAPKGAGFLFAQRTIQHLLKPLVVSWGYEPDIPGTSQFIDLFEWTGTCDLSAFLSVPAAIRFQSEHDWERIRFACRKLAQEADEKICQITGLKSLSVGSRILQMVSIPVPDYIDLVTMKDQLYTKYRIEVPLIQWNGKKLLRVSLQGYNSHKDINGLLAAVRELGVGRR